MTKHEITEIMIQQAEELKRLGLCQGAKEKIWELRGAYHVIPGDELLSSNTVDVITNEGNRIGPLATASECCDGLSSGKVILLLGVVQGFMIKHGIKDINQAFRQARIELAKE